MTGGFNVVEDGCRKTNTAAASVDQRRLQVKSGTRYNSDK